MLSSVDSNKDAAIEKNVLSPEEKETLQVKFIMSNHIHFIYLFFGNQNDQVYYFI